MFMYMYWYRSADNNRLIDYYKNYINLKHDSVTKVTAEEEHVEIKNKKKRNLKELHTQKVSAHA